MPRGEKLSSESLAGLRGRLGRQRLVRGPDSSVEGAGQMGLLFSERRGEAIAGVTEFVSLTEPIEDGAGTPETSIGAPQSELDGQMGDMWTPSRGREQLSAGGDAKARNGGSVDQAIWSVRALVGRLRERIEGTFREVLVEGEISTCRPASSGHLYLTLKEGETQLSVVLFRRQAQLLRFRPQQGMAVLARGRLSVYEGRGELQLVAESLEPRGTGALLLAFERLKERLGREGLFEASRKRALPAYPRCVGVVTSTAGAVLHDVITVVRRRHARLNLLIYPAAVQGPGCAVSVARGVRWFNAHPGLVDLVLLARGGGSPEDLCGFNDEDLAREIARSELPVVTAIGHETDFTIADFVADLRAPTPSAAAEVITASQHRVEERVLAAERGLRRSLRLRMLEARERFAQASASRLRARVEAALDRRGQRLDELGRRLERGAAEQQLRRRKRLQRLELALDRQQIGAKLLRDRERLERLTQWMEYWGPMAVERRRSGVEHAAARLRAMSPLAVLERGYALVFAVHDGNGTGEEKATISSMKLLRSSQETGPGQRVIARLARGEVEARVTAIQVERDGE